jgi:hypothetical protein
MIKFNKYTPRNIKNKQSTCLKLLTDQILIQSHNKFIQQKNNTKIIQ